MNSLILCMAIAVAGQTPIGGNVLAPPEDGRQYATIVFTSGTCRGPGCRDEEILSWFDRDPRLASLKRSTHFFAYTPQSKMWRDRFARSHDNTAPSVWIQDWTGAILCKFGGVGNPPMPATAEQLGAAIDARFNELRARNPESLRPQDYPSENVRPPNDSGLAVRPFFQDVVKIQPQVNFQLPAVPSSVMTLARVGFGILLIILIAVAIVLLVAAPRGTDAP